MTPVVKEVTVTPEMALDLLTKNTHNRRLNPRTVKTYANDMRAGRWNYVGDPIRIDVNGVILDGQHRLSAIMECELEQPCVMITGLAPETQRFMDIGRKRTAADNLRIDGRPHGSQQASVARMVMAWESGELATSSQPGVSSAAVLERIDTDPDTFEHAAYIGKEVQSRVGVSSGVCGGCWYWLNRKMDADMADVDTFFHLLLTGSNLQPGNPVLVLRETFLRRKAAGTKFRNQAGEHTFYVMATFNNWSKGKTVTKLQLPHGGITRAVLDRIGGIDR